MSKIKVFVKSDGITPSSFVVPEFRRLGLLAPTGKKPINSERYRYCHPCEVHDGREPSVSLDTYAFDPTNPEGKFLGVRRYCFLCWQPVEKVLKKD